jgi:two-component sensor histidine kinase
MSYTDSEGNIDWSKSSFNVFNIDSKKYKNYHGNLLDIVIDDDLHYWEEAYAKCSLSHPEEICLLRIKNDNDKLMYIRSYIICNFDENGNELGHFTFYQDVTEEIKYQKQLETALNDKEILLSEVHHRVKNNLQIILSLINLNKNYQTDPEIILNDTETRIYAMALIHEKIYDSTSLSEVNIKDYVYALINSLFDTYWSNINFHGDIEPINLDMDYSIPLGLIVNELVTNTIKHAFPDDTEGNLYIKFEKEDKHCILTVKDDGVGLPVDFNIDNLSTLGLVVVQSLTLQIGGTINIIDTEGTEYKIEFDVE